ncbi:hypothetical protein NHQ30_006480 [Ciborinia camelliae]|nr:hypothetical protein NHQ30_006480 [Ciborinia camelliae]
MSTSTSTSTTNHLSSPFSIFSPFLSPSTTALLLIIISTYLLIVRRTRFTRRDKMLAKFGYTTRDSFKDMSNTDAQRIIAYVGELEFPRFYMTSLQFALFKTYGIPSISKLLVDTKQLSSKETASKRYADTTILIGEFLSHPPLHPRVLKAIARMNYLHSSYQKSGRISNADLLYTLSVFITEPVTWMEKFEWRSLNDMEVCAIATFWKGIGDAMGINYGELRRGEKEKEKEKEGENGKLSNQEEEKEEEDDVNVKMKNNKGEWKDGIEFYEDIKKWAEDYERKFMLPNPYNKKTAEELIPLLLFLIPTPLLPFAKDAVGVLMGPRLRSAMIYPDPSPLHTHLTHTLLRTRAFILRHLSLPRPSCLRVRQISPTSDHGSVDGRFHSTDYLVHPYYQKPGIWNRWGPMALATRLLGGFVPRWERTEWWPQGYRVEEVGPERSVARGLQEMRACEEELRRERTRGCPFAFGNS